MSAEVSASAGRDWFGPALHRLPALADLQCPWSVLAPPSILLAPVRQPMSRLDIEGVRFSRDDGLYGQIDQAPYHLSSKRVKATSWCEVSGLEMESEMAMILAVEHWIFLSSEVQRFVEEIGKFLSKDGMIWPSSGSVAGTVFPEVSMSPPRMMGQRGASAHQMQITCFFWVRLKD